MLVFVYGTLKRGYGNHYRMNEAKGTFVGESKVKGFGCLNTPWYPYAVKSPEREIVGEVFDVPDNNIFILDRLEGYPNHYNRVQTQTDCGVAWIYYNETVDKYNVNNYGWTEEWKK